MQVQSENGSVIISNIAAKHVSTNAQNPGPSGSAVIERENYFILIISMSKNYMCVYSFAPFSTMGSEGNFWPFIYLHSLSSEYEAKETNKVPCECS